MSDLVESGLFEVVGEASYETSNEDDFGPTLPTYSKIEQRETDCSENNSGRKCHFLCFSNQFSFSNIPRIIKSLDERSIPFPKLDQVNFGECMKENGYKEVECSKSQIYYIDLENGYGKDAVKMDDAKVKLQQIKFDYNLYDGSSSILVNSNKSIKRDMCHHEFGRGFEKGIQGMRIGGIRRIVIPPKLTSKHPNLQVKEYAIFDVQLLKVGRSINCHCRRIFTHDNQGP